MSVCFSLMKPINKKIELCQYDLMTPTEFKTWEEAHSLSDIDIFESSNANTSIMFDISSYNAICKNSRTRLKKQLKKICAKFDIQLVETRRGWTYKGFMVEEICYSQGWFLKHNFFKKPITIYLATTKEEMISFFNQYLDKSEEARICKKKFIENWKNGMIFECAF